MKRFLKSSFAVALALAGFASFATEPTELVTIVDGVATVHPEFITNKLLTMQSLVYTSVIGMIILAIVFTLIIRKGSGAAKMK